MSYKLEQLPLLLERVEVRRIKSRLFLLPSHNTLMFS